MLKKFHKTKKSKHDKELNLLKNVYIKVVEGDLAFLQTVSNIEKMKFTNYNWNILHLAVWYEKGEIVQYLMEQPYKDDLLNEKDNNKEVPLHLSAFNKNADIFAALVRAGADSNDKNLSGQSALEVIQQESERLKFVCKLKNKSNGEDEKISRIFDSYSNFNNLDNSDKATENLEKNPRFHSADISNNIDKWGQDIPFEILSFDKERIETASLTNNNYNNRLFFELKMKNLRISEENVDFRTPVKSFKKDG